MKQVFIILIVFLVLLGPLFAVDMSFRYFMHDEGISIYTYIGLIIFITLFLVFLILPAARYFSDANCPKCGSKKIRQVYFKKDVKVKNAYVVRGYDIELSQIKCECTACGNVFELKKKPLRLKFYPFFFSASRRGRSGGFGGGRSGGGGAGR